MESIYERYKEALKAGHLAVLRGRLEEAAGHYRTAAGLADERGLPHVGLGGVLLRLGRIDEALTAYARALGRAPRDEAALAGRADALVAAGRGAEAGELLDRLSAVLEESGRLEEALRTLRRALESGETRRRLARERRLMRLLGPSAARSDATAGDAAPAVEAVEALHPADASAEAVPPAETGADDTGPATTEELIARADAAAAAGEPARALELYLEGAALYRDGGAIDAALDACGRALAVTPAAPDLHLTYVRLYLASGWRDHAAEKLLLLQRLLALDGSSEASAEAASLAAEAFGQDPRFGVAAAPPPAS